MIVQQILVNKVQRWINAEGRYLNKGVEKETDDVEMKKCTGLIILVEVYKSVVNKCTNTVGNGFTEETVHAWDQGCVCELCTIVSIYCEPKTLKKSI